MLTERWLLHGAAEGVRRPGTGSCACFRIVIGKSLRYTFRKCLRYGESADTRANQQGGNEDTTPFHTNPSVVFMRLYFSSGMWRKFVDCGEKYLEFQNQLFTGGIHHMMRNSKHNLDAKCEIVNKSK